MQTARIDYNIDAKNTAWFRFQADTGLQAAYTDPINPLFNAISSQPLYSFASGYTHVFSGRLVNYFNPAFSWYESLFGPADLQKTLAAFPIVLQGSGANAPFTTLGGLDNTWVQGRRATRFFINDNLAWTVGSHELRFGTNNRIFRLNDYDFGEGAVPLVTYATLPQFIYGVASTASKTFPLANSQPYNFLNLDFYAQDTWKLTRTLTWTFGVRDTYNSNPLNPHNAVARLAGSFDSISHDVNQPLSQVIRHAAGDDFRRHPGRDPPAAHRHRVAVCAEHRAAKRLRTLQRHPAGQRGRSRRNESSLLEDLSGRACSARSEEWRLRPGVPNSAIDATAAANQALQLGARERPAFLRVGTGQSQLLPSAHFDHRGSGRQTPCALLHAVELRDRASNRQRAQSASSVCRHARRQPALRDAGERLSDRLRGLLRAVPIRAAAKIRASGR